jgi:LPS sulfotransferase NodH
MTLIKKMRLSKHIVLTHGRSGSNYIVSALNNHPEILNYGEVLGVWVPLYRILGKRRILFPTAERFLNWVYKSKLLFYVYKSDCFRYIFNFNIDGGNRIKDIRKIKTIGIKEFSVNFHNRCCFDFLKLNLNLKVIYLKRENLLQRYISLIFMRNSNVWVNRGNRNKVKKIIVDIDDMLHTLNAMRFEEREIEYHLNKFKGSVLEISYDKYFKSLKSINYYNKLIFEFLGVSKLNVTGTHKKILPKKLKDKIQNYDEVTRALVNTEYECFLDNKTI